MIAGIAICQQWLPVRATSTLVSSASGGLRHANGELTTKAASVISAFTAAVAALIIARRIQPIVLGLSRNPLTGVEPARGQSVFAHAHERLLESSDISTVNPGKVMRSWG